MSDGRAHATAEVQGARTGGSPLEVLGVSTRLGLTSFGGPIAHLGYFREEYVVRRRWIDKAHYLLPPARRSSPPSRDGSKPSGLPRT
jgi:chromate transporter